MGSFKNAKPLPSYYDYHVSSLCLLTRLISLANTKPSTNLLKIGFLSVLTFMKPSLYLSRSAEALFNECNPPGICFNVHCEMKENIVLTELDN